MVDADDGQRGGVLVVLDGDRDGGVVKGGVDRVDGDGVVGVGGVARDVDDNAQLAARLREEVVVDEGRDGLGEVDLFPVSFYGLVSFTATQGFLQRSGRYRAEQSPHRDPLVPESPGYPNG